jgi:hypothetical protein
MLSQQTITRKYIGPGLCVLILNFSHVSKGQMHLFKFHENKILRFVPSFVLILALINRLKNQIIT